MREEYKEELENLRVRMEKAEKFAERLPIFSDKILSSKMTGEEDNLHFGDRYKSIPLAWGIRRFYYRSGSNCCITNYPKDKEYSCHLFNIYINTINLFDKCQEFGLYDYLKDVNIFFADELNTTFYVTDENIEAFLEAINTWYCDAVEKVKAYNLAEEEAELKKRLEEIKQRKTA